MTVFPLHTLADAPAASRPALQSLQDAFGFVPAVAGAIAGSPTLADAFVAVFRNAHAGTLDEAQIQALLLTNAVTNACEWAVAFHSALALRSGVSAADVAALRRGFDPSDPRLAAPARFTRRLVERRGHAGEAHVQALLDGGCTAAQALEVVLVAAASTITNYVATLAQPPLDDALRPHAWRPD